MQLSFLSTGVCALLIASANAAYEARPKCVGRQRRKDDPSNMWLAYFINWNMTERNQVVFTKDPKGKFKFWRLDDPIADIKAGVRDHDGKFTILEGMSIGAGLTRPVQLYYFDNDPKCDFHESVLNACVKMLENDKLDCGSKGRMFPEDYKKRAIKDHNELHPGFVDELSTKVHTNLHNFQERFCGKRKVGRFRITKYYGAGSKRRDAELERLNRAAELIDDIKREIETDAGNLDGAVDNLVSHTIETVVESGIDAVAEELITKRQGLQKGAVDTLVSDVVDELVETGINYEVEEHLKQIAERERLQREEHERRLKKEASQRLAEEISSWDQNMGTQFDARFKGATITVMQLADVSLGSIKKIVYRTKDGTQVTDFIKQDALKPVIANGGTAITARTDSDQALGEDQN